MAVGPTDGGTTAEGLTYVTVDDSLCSSTNGSAAGAVADADAGKPPRTQACSLDPTCSCVSDQDCVGVSHSVCNTTSGNCGCAPGWAGTGCEVPLLTSTTLRKPCQGVVDVLGDCCTGPVDAKTGVCCPTGSTVDKRGSCCVGGRVDACGVCNGTGVALDVEGTCCSTPLPPSGICCRYTLDSCGVCGGDNKCMAKVTTIVSPAWLAAGNAITADIIAQIFGVDPSRVTSISVSNQGRAVRRTQSSDANATDTVLSFTLESASSTSGESSETLLAAMANPAVSWMQAPVVERQPWCGNQLCELGEACTTAACTGAGECRADCPVPILSCESSTLMPCGGQGVCLAASGTCSCFEGYSGPSCQECAPSYLRSGTTCTFLPGALASCVDQVRNGDEEDVDCGGSLCAPCDLGAAPGSSGGPSVTVLAIACVVVAVVVGMVVGAVVLVRNAKLKRRFIACPCCRSSAVVSVFQGSAAGGVPGSRCEVPSMSKVLPSASKADLPRTASPVLGQSSPVGPNGATSRVARMRVTPMGTQSPIHRSARSINVVQVLPSKVPEPLRYPVSLPPVLARASSATPLRPAKAVLPPLHLTGKHSSFTQ